MSGRTACVSVDVDSLDCYHAIHGLPPPGEAGRAAVVRDALPRFVDLFERRGLRATFFVVGRDLDLPGAREAVAELARRGHEVGNHSYSHRYDLTRLPRQVIDAEVRRAHDAIAQATGPEGAPVGFRAPGYGLSPDLLDALCDRGYRYDSSMFPSWPYYTLKAAIIGAMAVVGRRSASILGDPRQTLAPAEPYRPDVRRPWRRGQSPVVELPVAVATFLRLPAIGTTFVAAPDWVRARVLDAVRHRPLFNLELHAIELCDAADAGVDPALVARRPDLRVPLRERRRALAATLDRIAMDFDLALLRDAAATVQRYGSISAS